jgi:hypothetical protein
MSVKKGNKTNQIFQLFPTRENKIHVYRELYAKEKIKHFNGL